MTASERQQNMTAYLESLIVYQKTIIIGKANVGGHFSQNKDVKVEVILRRRQDGGEGLCLSMVGEAPDSFGQWQKEIRDHISRPLIPGEQIDRMGEVWERWHLNDMRAGCEHQRAAGEHSAWFGDQGDYSGVRIGYPRCLVCGYSYGSKWLYEELPAEIVEEIKSW